MSGTSDPPDATSSETSEATPQSSRATDGFLPPGSNDDRVPTERTDTAASGGSTEPGLRARLVAHDPPGCPVVDILPDGAVASDVRVTALDGVTVEQFRTDRPIPAEPVFAADGRYVYRRRVATQGNCPYRAVEALGYPVTDATVRTNPDQLQLSIHLPSVDPLGDVVEALESAGARVTLDRLTRSGSARRADPIVIDRERLTDRQREVLRTARRMGYFAYPREASADEVADAVGIARSTFAEHLAAAQRRVVGALVDEHGTDG
ncbi:helix-turn-helix domain-containing protein [Halorubrum tibetense]|uniref:Helix-turn-helix domain-containing protein n=1 Tax=Halorubrum tibetense TaxID=175631 RepID=A0ABD5SCN1_9EURY